MAFIVPNTITPDKSYQINGVTINDYLLKNHNTNNINLPTKRTKKFKGVVIHNTPPANSADDGRQYTAATLNDNVDTRTHYYVTNIGAWKNLDDTDMNWSCGDGTVGEGNNGCISLEIIMGSKTGSNDLKARDNGARLAAYILYMNKLTVDSMYTHNYFLNIRNKVSGDYYKLCTTPTPTRNCPYYIVWDWENFRKQVDGYVVRLGGKSAYPETEPVEVKETIYCYKAVSQAAIRSEPSKTGTIYKRVTKGLYYVATKESTDWIKHLTEKGYSMLNDQGALFINEGECERTHTTTTVNVRSAPTTKSNIVTTLNKGEVVYVFIKGSVRNDGHTWRMAVVRNRICYIAGEYIE